MATANFDDLIGVPFAYDGRGPEKYDCYGLVMELSRRDGIILPDFIHSSDMALNAATVGVVLPQWEQIEKCPGAIALIRIGKYVAHVGYVIDDNRMIHTWEESGGVTIQRLDAWQHRIVGFYRYAGN